MAPVRVCGVVAIAVLVIFTSSAGAQPASPAAAQADFAAGNYRACLQKISQVLGGKLAPGGSKDRYDLLMLRGECMLNLKNPSLAAEAFDAASRVTFAKEDIKPTAAAQAVAILVERSSQLIYKPTGKPDAQGIDIVKPDDRKKAMAALLDELLPAAKAEADAATKSRDVAVMRKALAPIADAYVVELTTSGDAKQSTPLFKQVGSHARTFIAGEVERLQNRAEELNVLATEPKVTGSESASPTEHRGLTADERKELEKAAEQLEALRLASQDGRRISRRLGSTGENWDPIIADCGDARDRIRQALAIR
jgi:hypothetical protein